MLRQLSALALCGSMLFAQDDMQSRVYRARDRALPALVNVRPVVDVFQGGRRRRATATGSGVIVREDGLVVTNFHVVSGVGKVQVRLSDRRVTEASVVGADAMTDIALLKIDLDNLIPAEWGDSDKLEVGDLVWALGATSARRFLEHRRRLHQLRRPCRQPTGADLPAAAEDR